MSQKPKRKKETERVLITFRIPEPHIAFLQDIYPGARTLSERVRLYLARKELPRRVVPRELRGLTARQCVKLSPADWRRLERLAERRRTTPGAALVADIGQRAENLGYRLVTERARAVW